jgi:hypothetical protein
LLLRKILGFLFFVNKMIIKIFDLVWIIFLFLIWKIFIWYLCKILIIVNRDKVKVYGIAENFDIFIEVKIFSISLFEKKFIAYIIFFLFILLLRMRMNLLLFIFWVVNFKFFFNFCIFIFFKNFLFPRRIYII